MIPQLNFKMSEPLVKKPVLEEKRRLDKFKKTHANKAVTSFQQKLETTRKHQQTRECRSTQVRIKLKQKYTSPVSLSTKYLAKKRSLEPMPRVPPSERKKADKVRKLSSISSSGSCNLDEFCREFPSGTPVTAATTVPRQPSLFESHSRKSL